MMFGLQQVLLLQPVLPVPGTISHQQNICFSVHDLEKDIPVDVYTIAPFLLLVSSGRVLQTL